MMTMLDLPQSVAVHSAIGVAGLVSCYVLMFGLWRMSVPATSTYGMRVAGSAMLVAGLAAWLYGVGRGPAAVTLLPVNSGLAAIAVLFGGGFGWWRARRAQPLALPRLALLFNGLIAAAAAGLLLQQMFMKPTEGLAELIVAQSALLLATVALSGSLTAMASLSGSFRLPLHVGGRAALIGALLFAAVALGVQCIRTTLGLVTTGMTMLELEALFVLCGLLCGLTMSASLSTVEIPVAASMYNTMAGAAAASIGVLLQLPALMVVGSLVAGAGVALARLLAQSMNRSVGHVLLQEAGKVARSGLHTEAADAAIFMRYARKVVIVPGYGLAVAQAQQKLHELIRLLQAAGVDVKLALHPMAGRRPEQMAQLLAEVGVPEDLILWSGETDEHFRSADVALIIGANDVVNPTTSTIKSLPVFGVPCLNAALSGRIYLIKRGAGSGYAGIANASFASDHCKLVLGDAQIVLTKMVDSLRILQVPAAA